MNISTFTSLYIGQSALNTTQNQENVVGNNISNANTPGYAKEVVNVSEGTPFPTEPSTNAPLIGGQFGQGASIQSITRAIDPFYNQQDRQNQSAASQSSAFATGMTQVEGVLNEPSSGSLQNALDTFFSSWQTVSQNPSDSSARQTVLASAQGLAQTYQTVTNQLETTQQNLNQQVSASITQVNQDATQIATLNAQIARATASGDNPNTLYNQRAAVLDSLSKLTNYSYTEQASGMVSVSVGSTVLVSGSSATPVSSLTSTGGSIAGNSQTITQIQSTLGKLNTFLQTLSTTVNNQVTAGYPLSGTANAPALFQSSTDANGNTVLSVAPLTPSQLGVAGSPNSPGDNTNAQKVMAIQNQNTLSGGTFDQFIGGMVSQVGITAQGAIQTNQTNQALLLQSHQLRQSVSGVNLNNEATQLIQYQNAYSAAAKFISVFDSMMQTLMQMNT
ncbi:flagellar hook-associated protein FlgK [Ferroacidibacillus organovorans]|uniref:Flagellar hook-associated protein 1 n=1 Tax=Ferroacidibacillus organovorans TaxID=1765683 RepID=A0A101XQI0_9BACL|nr:flagellar hook-associated protein FlgK [Ferroacidibacillus organovorans]KUO95700.1 hypothetical protein ATW55_13195 [Ferroacidibacillus organovorans]